MKTNKIIARILIMVIVLSTLASSIAIAEGKVIKEETVYVNLNNEGKAVETISSIWLHSETPLKYVEDNTILKEVINVKGDEIPTFEDDKLIWKSEEKDIYYQGKTDKELPISIEIKYYLDVIVVKKNILLSALETILGSICYTMFLNEKKLLVY